MEKFPKKKFQELVKNIQYHNNLYYNNDSPEISDAEYDALINEYKNIKKLFPEETMQSDILNKIGGRALIYFQNLIILQECYLLIMQCQKKTCKMFKKKYLIS